MENQNLRRRDLPLRGSSTQSSIYVSCQKFVAVTRILSHPSGNKMPIYCVSTIWYTSGEPKWQRRVNSHAFECYRMKIFQAGHGNGVYVFVRRERCLDFSLQPSAYAWSFQKIICYTAQNSRRCFTSSCASSDINTEVQEQSNRGAYTKSEACAAS